LPLSKHITFQAVNKSYGLRSTSPYFRSVLAYSVAKDLLQGRTMHAF
jgi:hypothetical protein